MTIKSKLQLSSAITAVFVLVIVGVIFVSRTKTDQLTQKTRISHEIMQEIFELNALTQDYLFYSGERARIQWNTKHRKIQELLGNTMWSGGGDDAQIRVLKKEHSRLRIIFDEISTHSFESGPGQSQNSDQESRGRLVSQFRISSQTMVSVASTLAMEGLEKRDFINDMFDLLVFGILLGSLLSLVASTILIYRGIELPLAQLHHGTDLLAGGDLDCRLDSERQDEFGQIARSFNEMTKKLKKAHDDLTLSKKDLEEKVADLDKFNKIVVGRELKMIELKKEIETLREKSEHV